MGLLDDAIREHLDLKRRRGADPAEVARLEHEALGPVRREPAPAERAAAEHPEAAPEPAESAPAEVAEPHADAPPPVDAGHQADDATRVLEPEDRHDPPHGDPLFESHEADPELGGAAAREPEAEAQDPRHSDVVHQPTTEFRVEDHHDEPEQQEDVLEETPDFLQETPEHDRLWFEQRPPRDFDFDG
jgi:hypothetical protein